MRIVDRYGPALVCVMVALGSSSASAISVVLLTQDRSISASAYGCHVDPNNDVVCGGTSDSDAAVAFDVFDSTVSAGMGLGSAIASQFSTVTSSLISASVHTTASGSSAGPGNYEQDSAGSVLRISFSATEPTPYAIQGSLQAAEAGGFGSEGSGRVSILLRDSLGGVLWGVSGDSLSAPLEFANSGILAPGDYLLEADAQSRGVAVCAGFCNGSGFADFSFEFSIVPEPSTAASLGLGLALLALRNGRGRERRRRDAAPAPSSVRE
jgi:hypothetical protein